MDSSKLALLEQRNLLQMEYEAEKKSFTEVCDGIGIGKLCERGQAWWPVESGRNYINALNQRVVEVVRTQSGLDEDEENEKLRESPFEPGKPVMFFSVADDGTVTYLFGGNISFVEALRMVVAVADSDDLSLLTGAGEIGVMTSFDETSYRAMFEALDKTIRSEGRLGQLREIFHSGRPVREYGFERIGVPYLNSSQEDGINKILHAKDVAIVHGPPGTGKTTTLVEAIVETLRREPQVLVCAQSNMAVDWICEKLTDRGVNLLRIGNPARVNDRMLAHTYERRFEDHPDYPTLWKIRSEIRKLYKSRKSVSNWHQKLSRLKGRATELEYRINEEIFGQARVVASTLVGSGNKILSGRKFTTLFIDEAAQALEAACWIAIRKAGRVVLAGDHCQLPATVKCYEALKQGLGTSLMERLVERHPEAVTLLTTQYRMHEDIMRFSSRWFYDNRMVAAPQVRHRGILDLDTAMEWVDTSTLQLNPTMEANEVQTEVESEERGVEQSFEQSSESTEGESVEQSGEQSVDFQFQEEEFGRSGGRINRDEALLTILVLQNYIERIGMKRVIEERIDFGLISPYRAQVNYLRRLVKNTPFFRPLRKRIAINTVDGFQGQERDVIVISLVRSNDNGQIGFLRDLRRMNVAITRARMKVIMIGDASTLGRHRFYGSLYRYVNNLKTRSDATLHTSAPAPFDSTSDSGSKSSPSDMPLQK